MLPSPLRYAEAGLCDKEQAALEVLPASLRYAETGRSEREQAALEVLRSTGIDVLEAALVAREALARGRGRVKRARACIQLGEEQLRLRERTVNFAKAVETALEDRKRKGLRARSIVDFRYLCKRMMKLNPGLAERRVRSISSEDCQKYLETAFNGSAAQYRKARAIMSGVFSTAIRHDWCDSNPVARVEVPEVVEKPIEPLTIEEVERLEAAAQLPEHQEMQLSLHLMLYCGIRPTEVSRIDPERDIDWQNQRVVVRPTTSKTGGGRVVPLRGGNIDALRHDIPRRWVQRWRGVAQGSRVEQGNRPPLAARCLPPHLRHLPRGAFPQLPRSPTRNGSPRFQPAAYTVRVRGERHRSVSTSIFPHLILDWGFGI